MKKLISLFFITLSFNLWAQDCEKVFTSCLKEIVPSKTLQQFLSLEQTLGWDNEMRFLRLFKGYEIVQNESYNLFTYQYSTYSSLNELGKWAAQKIAPFNEPDYDGFQMLKSAKRMNDKEFKTFMIDLLIDFTRNFDALSEVPSESQENVKNYLKIQEQAEKELISLVFNRNYREVTVYELLDNNNENVSEVQYVVTTPERVFVINQHWPL